MENKISIKTGFLIALIVTILLCVYSVALGKFAVTEAWAGYLFFWFWGQVRGNDLESLKCDIPSSLVGIILGLLVYVKHAYSDTAYSLVVVAVLLVILFFAETKVIPHIVNAPTFLFFTVLTANIFLDHSDYLQIFISYVTGVLFFGITLGVLGHFMSKRGKEKQ
jgi:hypothetical protein